MTVDQSLSFKSGIVPWNWVMGTQLGKDIYINLALIVFGEIIKKISDKDPPNPQFSI